MKTMTGKDLAMASGNSVRKAYVVAAHSAYFPGLVASLNGLDYYGTTADVHWIYDDAVVEDEADKTNDLLSRIADCHWNFKILPQPMSSLVDRWPPIPIGRHRGWKFRFYKYKYLQDIADHYDAIGCFDADLLVLSNLNPWFDLAAGSKYMLTADHNYTTYMQISQYDEEYAKKSWRSGPVGNFPMLCNPREWCDVFETTWQLACSFSEDALEMAHFNRAIWECGKTQDVVVLPDAQWNRHWLHRFKLQRVERDGYLPLFFVDPAQLIVQTIHGRWWSKKFCQGEIDRTGENEILEHNLAMLLELYTEILSQGKLKYGQPSSG